MARKKKTKKKAPTIGTCVLCGEANIEVTKEHVPPRSLFPKPRPKDLITVPACKNCNNSTSQFDNRYTILVTGKVTERGGEQRIADFFNDKKLRGMGRDQHMRSKLINDSKQVDLVTPSGIFIEEGWAIPWDNVAEEIVTCKLVKGLYYHHYGEVLPQEVPIKNMYFNSISKDMLEAIAPNISIGSVGGGDFVYATARLNEKSIWLFQFYKKHWTGAVTGDF